jgi:AsmA family
MKKLLKIFSWFIVIIIVLIIVLTVVAKLAENKITDIALRKVSESIEAPVTIDNVSFNLLRKFPLATIELNNVLLKEHKQPEGIDSLSTDLDTLISIQKLYISVKSRPLLKGNVEIIKVDIDGANINYLVDSNGISNIDFLMTSSEPEETDTLASEPLKIDITDFTATNIVCNYKDDTLKAAAKIEIPELKVKAKVEGENISASLNGDIKLSDCSFEETNLHLMNNTNVNFAIDYENDSVSIKKLIINTDGADLELKGNVLLADDIKTDVFFKGENLILDELIKYAPEEMLQEFGLQKVTGKMNMDASVKGIYSDNELPKVDLNVNLQDGNVVTKDYPALKNISFQGKITNGILCNNKSTQADFSTFYFETQKSKFDFAFSVLDIDNPKYSVRTNVDINLSEFKKFIPDSLAQNMKGRIKASISTKGELPDSIGNDFIDLVMQNTRAKIQVAEFNVDVEPDISIRDFSTVLTYKPNNVSLSNLNIDIPTYGFGLQNTSLNTNFYGSINNTSELSLNVKSYHLETKGAVISGFIKVKNLDNPSYETETRLAFNLNETKSILPDSLLTDLSGSLIVDIKSKATLDLDSIADQAIDVAFNKSTVHVEMKNITAILPDDPLYKIENLSGVINMSPEALTINKVRGIAAGLSFEIDSTEVWNSYEAFVLGSKEEIFTVQTNIKLGEITNTFLEAFMPPDTTSVKVASQESTGELVNTESVAYADTTAPQYLLPNLSEFGLPHFLIRGKLAIAKLEYEKNIIDDISLKFRFADSLYVIDQFKLSTCGGQMNTSVLLNARGRFWEKPVIDIRTKIDKLNINELLIVNDNFGDTSITYEKFAGLLTSEFDARVFYVPEIKPIDRWPTDRIRAEGHFTLENGKIYGYEPLVDLSKNKILGGLKGLDKLDFNTLTTSIFMYKDNIYVPETDVVTSSMDMTAFAMHSLKGDFEYHIKAYPGDLFTGKKEELMKKQEKQDKINGDTYDRSGGLKLLSMEIDGTKKNGFDNDKLKEKFELKLNKQKGWLKLFFAPKLVNFSTEIDRTKWNKELNEKSETESEDK